MSKPSKKNSNPSASFQLKTPNNSRSQTNLDEYEDDMTSIYSLEKEIHDYVKKSESISQEYEFYPGAETMEYDFVAERNSMYSTNLIESTAHMIKGCLGAGILVIHEAFMEGGLWTSLACTIAIGIIVAYTMFMLVNSAQKMYVRLRVSRLSYPDLAEVAVATGPMKCCRKFGKVFRYIVDIFLLLQACSACCVFQIVMAITLKQVLEHLSTNMNSWQLSFSLYILITLVPLVLLCIIRNFKWLAPFTIIADIFFGVCIIATMSYSISVAGNIKDRPAWKSVHGLFRFTGVCIYSIDGISLALPIENNMKNPRYFRIALQFAMLVVLVSIASVGFFGYWGWGETCQSPITIQMPLNVGFIILQFLLVIMLLVTFALHFWVPFRIIWRYMGKYFKRKRYQWEILFRVILVGLITTLAITFPKLNRLISFIGNIFLAFVVLIFPAAIESMVTWKERRKGWIRWTLIKNLLIVLLGAFMCAGEAYSNILYVT